MKANDQIFSEISENGFITYKQAIEQAISEKFAKAVFL